MLLKCSKYFYWSYLFVSDNCTCWEIPLKYLKVINSQQDIRHTGTGQLSLFSQSNIFMAFLSRGDTQITQIRSFDLLHSLPGSGLTPRVSLTPQVSPRVSLIPWVRTGKVSLLGIVFVYNSLLSVYAECRWGGALQTEIARKILSTSHFLLSPPLLQTFTERLRPWHLPTFAIWGEKSLKV